MDKKRCRYHSAAGENKTGYWRIRYVGPGAGEVGKQNDGLIKKEGFCRRLEQAEKEVKERFPNTHFSLLGCEEKYS